MKTYKFKLYQSKKNKHLHQQINIAGLIYNHCIALHRRYYQLTGKSLNQYALMKHITKLKKAPKYSHWNLVGSQAIQDIVQRIAKAYKLFFGNRKRKVSDLARSEFMGILGDVASTKHKVVHLAGALWARFYASSKTCSACGQVNQALQLSARRWVCGGCGVIHNRDHNAAVNIQRAGASSLRLGAVRPAVQASPV